ncbi:MAG: hypothetical protein AB1497_01400 [Bacillota bacterium]
MNSAHITAAWVYTPAYRIRKEEYLSALGAFSAPGITEKSVAGPDEDPLTMAVEAVRGLLEASGTDPSRIRAMCLASTTWPYLHKHPGGAVAEATGLPSNIFTTCHFASGRAGTEALLTAVLTTHSLGPSLAVISDTPVFSPADPREHGQGAAAVALLVEPREGDAILSVNAWASTTRESLGTLCAERGNPYPSEQRNQGHADQELRDTIVPCVRNLFESSGTDESAFLSLSVNETDAKEPARYKNALGFSSARAHTGPVVFLGHTGACSGLLSLLHAASGAAAGSRLLLVSYGYGAACDAISFTVKTPSAAWAGQLRPSIYLTYTEYLRYRGLLP